MSDLNLLSDRAGQSNALGSAEYASKPIESSVYKELYQNEKAIAKIWRGTAKALLVIAIFLASIPILIMLPNEACAADERLYLGGISHHFGPGEYKERHALLIYERNRFAVGYWRNSYDKDTYYLGGKPIQFKTELGEFGVNLGFATGYPDPVVGSLYYQAGNFAFNLVPDEVFSASLMFSF